MFFSPLYVSGLSQNCLPKDNVKPFTIGNQNTKKGYLDIDQQTVESSGFKNLLESSIAHVSHLTWHFGIHMGDFLHKLDRYRDKWKMRKDTVWHVYVKNSRFWCDKQNTISPPLLKTSHSDIERTCYLIVKGDPKKVSPVGWIFVCHFLRGRSAVEDKKDSWTNITHD